MPSRRTFIIGLPSLGMALPSQDDGLVVWDCDISAADTTHDPESFELRNKDGARIMLMSDRATLLSVLLRSAFAGSQRVELRVRRED